MVARQMTQVDFFTRPRMRPGLISAADYLRQGPVVPYGTGQHHRHMVLHTAVYDTVVNVIILYELRNGSASSGLVDYVQMVVMAIGLGYLV